MFQEYHVVSRVPNCFKSNKLFQEYHIVLEVPYCFRSNILFQEYHVVAFDMRGYGDSSKPAGVNNYTMDLLVEDVRALVVSLGVERLEIKRCGYRQPPPPPTPYVNLVIV